MKKVFLLFLLVFSLSIFLNSAVRANNGAESLDITSVCIGNVCIGDTLEKIKLKNKDCKIKVNDSNTGYYLFDNLGNFLVEFSTKQSLSKKNVPVRYIMTSNPLYKYEPGNISLESRVSELIKKYGKPEYVSGPNGYVVSFEKWPIKETEKFKNYEVNTLVGVYNPKVVEMFKYSGTMNEKEELKVLYKHPENTVINTIEIFSDSYANGKPIK